jgi:hypothetical protein
MQEAPAMTMPPAHPKLYHITHVGNLRSIASDGELVSDRAMIARGRPVQAIGMSRIKRRRVEELELDCHPGTKVGDYVPFYFCPRSIMLYVIHRANHPELTYHGGQEPIVHLEADVYMVIQWAMRSRVRWAFSLTNAGARYTVFRSRADHLDQLDWPAIAATDFRSTAIKERKQAEFLIHGRIPLDLIERVGVSSMDIRAQAAALLADAGRRIRIEVRQDWYF